MRNVSKSERTVAQEVLKLLTQSEVGVIDVNQDALTRLLNALEYFVPEVLKEVEAGWTTTALDDVSPTVLQHMSSDCLLLDGVCLTMDGEELPLSVQISIAEGGHHLRYFRCRVGGADRYATSHPLYALAEFGKIGRVRIESRI